MKRTGSTPQGYHSADCTGPARELNLTRTWVLRRAPFNLGETNVSQLEAIARAMVAPGKGILAADESSPTIKKRFDSIQVESSEENRRSYREMLFTTAGAEEFISGVILFDETLRQSTADGTPFPRLSRGEGHHSRHQGRQGRQGPARRRGREGDRGPRRPARPRRRVSREPRRPLRQVARRDHHRRRHPQRLLPRRQRPRAGALRRALRRGRTRAHRRARSPDGRPAHDRALLTR